MGRRKKGDIVDGWVCLDKPFEMGSTEAVSRIRRLFNAQKAGHAGTLDPLASGILPIALGEATVEGQDPRAWPARASPSCPSPHASPGCAACWSRTWPAAAAPRRTACSPAT